MDEDATTSNLGSAETFDPDLIHAIFKLVWKRRVEKGGSGNDIDAEPAPETSRRNRSTTANATALKVSCELLRIFVTEAIQRFAFITEAEDAAVIEPTHLERGPSASGKLGERKGLDRTSSIIIQMVG